MRTPMIDEHNPVLFSRSEGDAYRSSQAAELSLNAAILRAEIARSYEELLDIFETLYDDDVEVSREDLPEMIRGKARVRPFLLNVLVPLHVMAEVAGLSISVQQTAVPGDTANETHSAWRIDFTGVGGRHLQTLSWTASSMHSRAGSPPSTGVPSPLRKVSSTRCRCRPPTRCSTLSLPLRPRSRGLKRKSESKLC
jgi:hypothetical protein